MKKWLIVFIVLLLPLVCAQEDYNHYESLDIEVSISNEARVISQGSYNVKFFETELSFFPKNYNYQIVSSTIKTTPLGDVEENEDIKIRWEDSVSSYSYDINLDIERNTDFIEIRKKVNFPALDLDDSLLPYIEATEFIDINENIIEKAEEIVQGEDDLYNAVFKLADWTENNVEYDLNTLTSDAVQKSSWVLQNKEGVCDELTNLFISFCRSLGIPARFVSGMAYTNVIGGFGAHGWSEVYIDGKWIPFDVTYGTFGWVDPSHIKFKDSVDSGESSARFSWQGSNLEFDIDSLDLDANVVHASGEGEKFVDVSVTSLKESVGTGSYVPIQVQVKNNHDYYIPVKLIVTKAPNVIGDNVKSILLSPGEEKSVFWKVRVDNDIQNGFIYTTFVEVKTMYGGGDETSFVYSLGDDVVSEAEADAIIAELDVDEEIDVLNVDLDCEMDKEHYYEIDQGVLSCSVEGVDEVCFLENCKSEDYKWILPIKDYNSQRYAVVARQGEKVKYEYFDLSIISDPSLSLEIYPRLFDFNSITNVTFTMHTDTAINDVLIDINHYGKISLENVERDYVFSLPVEGKKFYNGYVEMDVRFKDALGKEYENKFVESVNVNNIPFFYKILNWFNSMFR